MMEKNSPQNLQQTVRFFEKQLCALTDGIVITDPAKNIIFVNDIFCKFFSSNKQDMIKTNIFLWLAKMCPNAKDIWKGMEIQINENGIAKDVEFMMKYGEEMRYFSVNSSLIKNIDIEDAGLIISNWHDDTERKKAEEALKESEERYRRLVEFSPYGIAIHSEGKLVYINLAGAKILGTENPDKIVGKMLLQIIHPDYHEIVKNRIHMQEEGKIAPPLEEKFLRLDGTSVDVEIASIPFTYLGKLAMYGVFRDITERKRAEKQIQASLKEKEILLKEIHQRVNNNMQIISSLLGLQSISSKDKKVAEIFRISQNRINSMSLIHEKLYRSKDLTKIELNDYIRDLTNSLSMSRGIAGRVELILNIETISLGIDYAIPCGLIVNELITNSLKHAFPEDRNGEIKVSAHREDENKIELIFSDNGVGIPSNIDFRNTQSLGLHLVTILVQDQLNGKIDLDRTGGTKFKIIFKG